MIANAIATQNPIQNTNLWINLYPIGYNNYMMTKHHVTDPIQIARSENGRLGIIARAIAYDILKLPRVCETCGFSGRVEVHHINKDRDNNTRENLKILCRKCHNKVHGVILPKKKKTFEKEILEILPLGDSRYKYNKAPENKIHKERRRLATQAYREKWGISEHGIGKDPSRITVTCKICGAVGERLHDPSDLMTSYLCSANCRIENKKRQKEARIKAQHEV